MPERLPDGGAFRAKTMVAGALDDGGWGLAAFWRTHFSGVAAAADVLPDRSRGLTEPRPPTPATGERQDLSFLPTVVDGGIGLAETPAQVSSVLITLGMLTVITLAPGLLILMTCFTRIVIVLGFLRRALVTQTLPPDQVLVGLGLFLTFFIMAPTWQQSWEQGIRPYINAERDPETGLRMSQWEALERTLAPQRRFMFACLRDNEATEEVLFFMGVSNHKRVDPTTREEYWIGADQRKVFNEEDLRERDIPTVVLIPAFITAELRRAFWMGFLLYLPFLILDVVIASVLMAMGMMMLPPVQISLPFKIILFVLVDGWRLLMEGLVASFPMEVTSYLQNLS